MGKRTRAARPPLPEATPAGTPTFLARHAYWLVPFVLFLILRLFSGDVYFLLGGDQCTFLELGRTFPKHHLYNHEFYLIHGPPFGFAIGLLQLVLPLLPAGLLASLLFACGAFFALRSLAQFDGLPRAAVFAGLIFLALSRPAVAYDAQVARVSILVCATALAILAFLRLLREPCRKTLLVAIATNVFCLLVSDQALLLLPCEAVIFWARGSRRDWKWLPGLSAISVVAGLVWPAVRWFEFSRRPDVPAGIDGTIEFTRNFPLRSLLQPNFLPFTNTHRSLFTQTSLSLGNLKPALLASLPADLLLLPTVLSAALVILLIAAALAQPAHRRRAIQWLVLSLLFLLPVGMGMYEWYGMGFIVPFTLLMMEGAAACIAWAGALVKNTDRVFTLALSAASFLFAVLWLAAPPPEPHGIFSPRGGSYFLFTRPPVTRAATISKFFDKLPRETGIMAPVDLSPEIVYLTDKRVVAMPFDPALLDRFMDEYHISYLLTSSEFLKQYEQPVVDEYTGAVVARYLFDHPERFRRVASLRETYPSFYPQFDYYIFENTKVTGEQRH